MIFGNPISIGQLAVFVHDTMTGKVIDLARRILYGIENNILIIAGYHPLREFGSVRKLSIQTLLSIFILPGDKFI